MSNEITNTKNNTVLTRLTGPIVKHDRQANIKKYKELSEKTGCSLNAMNQIVKKGEGAYYSSGSRPNQTAKSWGLGRLASALTSGKAAAIDYDIINKGCNHNKTAFILANKSRNKYGYGNSKTKKVMVKI